jgi:hypothetical protein
MLENSYLPYLYFIRIYAPITESLTKEDTENTEEKEFGRVFALFLFICQMLVYQQCVWFLVSDI